MSALQGKTVVLGVSGGIAAYKACDLVSRLKKAGAAVYVIMTRNACEFVNPKTFQTLSHNPVAIDTFDNPQYWEVEHIALAQKADLFVIAPATANIIAKLSLGLADDMLSTTVLATQAPLLVAPAMNTQMYRAEPTQEHLNRLRARGWHTVGPEGGALACGDVGPGRMSEPQDILAAAERLLSVSRDYAGRKVLLTAGPTREAIDPVRYISNRSSGKMGYAIAEALLARGAEVTLLSGPVALTPPPCAELVPVTSTQDLYEAMLQRVGDAELLIQAAAPADFTLPEPADQKLKKQGDGGLTLQLRQTPDVARAAGERKKTGQVFVGFAAETNDHLDNARRKLAAKNLDMICLNDVSRSDAGFDVDTNALTLITRDSVQELPLLSKREAADRLLDALLPLLKAPAQ